MALPSLADLPPSVALGTVRSTNATGASPGVMRWSRVDSDIPRLMVSRTLGAAGEARCRAFGAHEARVGLAAADAGPQTTAEHAVVALYPHSTDLKCSRDGTSNEARASPRAPERRGEPGRDTWP